MKYQEKYQKIAPFYRKVRVVTRVWIFIQLLLGASWLPGPAPGWPIPTALAVEAASPLPAGYESYSTRPDALKITPQAHPDLGSDWQSLKRGHIEATAMLLEMYPDREIYFLARDSELLYDVARFAARDNPAQLARLHLLNISRANMRADHVKDYLAQEGISDATLQAGKRVLFVDTGFSGTIPRVISEHFPSPLRAQLQTHLMTSSNPEHPSCRAFLTAINPAAPSLSPGKMHGSIISYEHMARYTDRSDRFARVNGRWEPLSLIGGKSDGSVSKDKGRAYMEDLLAYVQEAPSQALLSERRAQWKKLKQLSQASGLSKEQLEAELRAMLVPKSGLPDPFSEAIVRDFLELRAKHLSGGPPQVEAQDLGLSAVASNGWNNKNELIKKYPQWASVLEDPDTHIPQLIAAGEWGKLGAIADAIQDQEIVRILAKTLGAKPPTPGTRQFIQMLVEKGDPLTLRALANFTFSQPNTAEMKDLLRLLIDKGDPTMLQALAHSTFTQPHTAEMKDLLRLLIDKGDPATLHGLAQATFSRPHTAEMMDQLRLLIEKGDPLTLHRLAQYTFSSPHTAEMKDQLRLLIEKGDPGTLQKLAEYTFSSPHTADMKDQLRLLIEKGDPGTRQKLAQYTFSSPHTAEMKDLFKLLIEKGDHSTLQKLAQYTFSQPHTAEMKDLLKLLIEKGDALTLQTLVFYTFSQPHTAEMKDLLRLLIEKGDPKTLQILNTFPQPFWSAPGNEPLQAALKVADPAARRQFLAEKLGAADHSHPPTLASGAAPHFEPISAQLKPGTQVKTQEGRTLVIEKFVDQGKRGVVYRVHDQTSGQTLALKVARESTPEILASLAEESAKAQTYQKLGLNHATVVEAQPTYVVKSWVEGTRADQWIRDWEKQGHPKDASQLKSLKELLERSAQQGAYVGDLNAKNLIWDGKAWVIVDSGGTREGLSVHEAASQYLEKIPPRWSKPATQEELTASCLSQALHVLTTGAAK